MSESWKCSGCGHLNMHIMACCEDCGHPNHGRIVTDTEQRLTELERRLTDSPELKALTARVAELERRVIAPTEEDLEDIHGVGTE